MKKKIRKKNINILTMNIGIDKYMRNHPLFGENYRREQNIKRLFSKIKIKKI